MGFVTLEDVEGNLELVVFPRSWERYSRFFVQDKVVIVEGKVDASGGDPKILVDKVTPLSDEDIQKAQNQAETAGPQAPTPQAAAKPAQAEPKPTAGVPTVDTDGGFDLDVVPPEFDDSEMPPMPDEADFAWEPQHAAQEPKPVFAAGPAQATGAEANAGAAPEPMAAQALPAKTAAQPIPVDPELAVPKRAALPELDVTVLSPAPRTTSKSGQTEPPKMVTILLHSSGDRKRDVLKLRCIHGALVSSPGLDRFNFQVYENGRKFSLDFPNDSTGVNPDLITRLVKLAGEENLRIDPIQ
jgi:DNA polymerase-3 subunit alpha